MPKKILVAYATRLGSAAGVAGAIGNALIEDGEIVDIIPVSAVRNIDQYHAVVVGSAIRGGAWLPEAVDFVRNNQKALAGKRFAVFLVCMTLAMPGGEKYREHVSSWLSPVRAMAQPLSEGLFAGRLDINKVESFADRLKFRLSVLFGVWAEGDHRDWEAVRSWARKIRPLLAR